MSADSISNELRAVLRRLKLSRLLDTLAERLTLARQQKMPHQDFLLLVLQDEAQRRNGQAATLRAQKAQLDPKAELEAWDPTAKVTFDHALLNELASLRFLDTHHNVLIVGPVGVGKTSSRTRSAASLAGAATPSSPCPWTRSSGPCATHGSRTPTSRSSAASSVSTC
jgi:DNA replication protein DnaC